MDRRVLEFKKAQEYRAQVEEALSQPITSKAAQKRLLEALGRVYEWGFHQHLIDWTDTPEAPEGLTFWEVPIDLHHCAGKKFKSNFAAFPRLAELDALLELRNAVKEAEIVAVERKEEVVEAVVREVRESLEAAKIRVGQHVSLAERWGVGISVSPHYVRNVTGTLGFRVFWYLNGRLCSLNTIAAIVHQLRTEGKIDDKGRPIAKG
jgi:hypothetical protein